MNADEFVAAVRCHVAPALETCGFQLRTSVSGRMYDAEFDSPGLIVSISYEPGDDFFLVVVFQLVDGRRSDIDDRDATPRLSDLNRRFLTPADASVLAERRSRNAAGDSQQRRIQQIGADLAIVVPRYMATLGLLQ